MKKAIIFTCIEVIIYFVIFVIHSYIFKMPSINAAFSKGINELIFRLIFGQIPIQLILLTMLFYFSVQYKILLAIGIVVLAHIVSLSILASDLNHVLDDLKFWTFPGYINILIMLFMSAILTALILRNFLNN